jgi:PHD/YefM family antitoxin component YafN of YafNO toxin-antitoxin module
MATQTMSSREFNQDTGRAKRCALSGPVYVTDRGRPSHVLLTFEYFLTLTVNRVSMAELLAWPAGVEDIHLETPTARNVAEPATFD